MPGRAGMSLAGRMPRAIWALGMSAFSIGLIEGAAEATALIVIVWRGAGPRSP